jgi:hypothetical protein
MDYVLKTKSSRVKLDGRELQDYVWVNAEEALKLDLEEYTRNFVLRYLEELRKK